MSLPAGITFGGDGGRGTVGGFGGTGASDSRTGTPPAAGDGGDTPSADKAGGGGGGGAGITGGSGGVGGDSNGAGGAAGMPGVDAGNGVGGGGHAADGSNGGGGGGAGGAHGYVGASLPTTAATGQDGGRGGDGKGGGGGGGGGAGGHGAVITGSGALGTLSVNITGGAGGAGGRGVSSSGSGEGGEGGDAGYGLVFESSLAKSVTINSTIAVQSPGPGEVGLPPGDPGSQAYAIVGENLDITLGANARIGSSGLGSIRFVGGTNALELQAGAVVSDTVAAFASTAATLRLGGTADASFDLDSLGVTYLGFDAIQKVGTSTWTVTGWMIVPHTWSIDAGTLQLAAALYSAPLTTVNATATLAGTASLGAVSVASGGTLSPGAGGFFTGNLALAAGAIYRADVNGATAGSGYDQIDVDGTVALGGATLDLSVDAAVAPGTVFTILLNDDIDAVGGTFAGLAEGATIDAGKARFSISYVGGDGNDVALTALPRGTAGDDSFTAQAGSERIDALGGADIVTFGFRLVDATVTYQGNTVVIDSASSHTVLTGVETLVFTDGTVDNNDGSPLVDDLFYYAQNHDVWNAHIDADLHYGVSGWHEGRDPNAFFDISLYRAVYPDVTGDPLAHFDTIGWKQHRVPSLGFGAQEYLVANPDVAAANIDPLWHFLAVGAGEGRQPVAPATLTAASGFDYVYYLQQNPDVAAAGVDPLQHFQTTGWHEGRNPNAFFDTAGYLATYTDVAAAGVNPLDHYHLSGWQEGRDPSLAFDTASYLAANPDVAAAHIDPLRHFLHSGIHEGRVAFADATWG